MNARRPPLGRLPALPLSALDGPAVPMVLRDELWPEDGADAAPSGVPAAAEPAVPMAAWTDRPFLYFRAANLVLKAVLTLHRAQLLPRAALPLATMLAQGLSRRGQHHRVRFRWRRLR